MSTDATHWAWKQQGLRPSVKLVLLSMADRADEMACCWPSCHRLGLDTGLERKTVLKAIAELRGAGLIELAGETRGKTNSVPVYKLNVGAQREDISSPKNGPGPKTGHVPKTDPSSPKNGMTKQSQKRDIESSSMEPTKKHRARAARPASVEEVRAYCKERGNHVDPEAFLAYYEANGWRQKGGNPIKDWKAAVRTWEHNGYSRSKGGQQPQQQAAI